MRFPGSLRFWVLVVFAPFVLMWLVAAITYAVDPVYEDHLEPATVIVAQQWLHGRPMYHTADSPCLYSLLYGPADFLSLALTLSLCPDPVLASKLSGGFWSLASLVLLLLVFRRLGGWAVAVTGVGVVACELLMIWLVPFWDRADPILIFAAALGLGALSLRNGKLGSLVLALAIALAVDGKIHGVLYLLPAVAIWWQRRGWLACLWVLVMAAVMAAVPFLLSNISLENYLFWLRMGARHPLKPGLFRENMQAFLLGLLPLALLAGRLELKWNRREIAEETVLFLTLLLAGLLTCIPASKAGAGPYHLLPLTVYVGYLFCVGVVNSPGRPQFTWAAGVVAVWCLLGYMASILNLSIHLWDLRQNPGRLVQADLRQILLRYPAAETQMGAGDEGGYTVTYSSPWLYREGTPCVLDTGAYMDMNQSGIGPEALTNSLVAEHFRYWLIPRNNRPFAMRSLYGQPLFDDSVARIFLWHYARVDSTAFFDIYQARGGAP